MDYDGLVKVLRYCGNGDAVCEISEMCPFYDKREEETSKYYCDERLMKAAADAIEELQQTVDHMAKQANKEAQR